jgi:hypothetical protein
MLRPRHDKFDSVSLTQFLNESIRLIDNQYIYIVQVTNTGKMSCSHFRMIDGKNRSPCSLNHSSFQFRLFYICFFLELVSYSNSIGDEKSLAYALAKPEKVKKLTREFSQERYGVDILKLEIPINPRFVENKEY